MNIVQGCYGGGRNSKTAIARWVEEGNPLHIVTIADPGAEKPETYLDVVKFRKWLELRRVRMEMVRVSGELLEENCIRRQQLPAIAYGFKTCSQRWKLEPQEKFMNNWQPAKDAWARGEKVIRLIGYHAGEPQRAKQYEDDKYINRYPLIEWGMDNEECAEWLTEHGLCVPPKSSCFFCPNMTETEILDLRDQHPDLLERALQMERNAKPNLVTIKGLARDLSWQQIVDYDRDQLSLIPPRVRTMPCECYDGE